MGKAKTRIALDKDAIFAGSLKQKGKAFRKGKEDVTSDVLQAVIDYIGIDNTLVISIDNEPKYKIIIEKI